MTNSTLPAEKLTFETWRAEGERRFGPDRLQWRFVCPCCGHVASAKEWVDAGGERMVAFSCIGRVTGAKREAFDRYKRPGPCNYAGGGLFALNPVTVLDPDGGEDHHLFAFAEAA